MSAILLTDERYQRQRDELQALESIFADDIVLSKIRNCWKVSSRLYCIILESIIYVFFIPQIARTFLQKN